MIVLAVVLSAFSTQAQSKVGTIDADYILSKMPEINTVNDSLKAYNTKLQQELQGSIKNYQDMVNEYQTNNATYTDSIKKGKEDKIIGLENEIKNFRQKASVLLQMKRTELTNPLYKKIDDAMKQIVEKDGYTQILNASANGLAFSDPKYDITDEVLKKLGLPTE